MCCFSGPVSQVSNTNIFARMVRPGVQALVYEMTFAAAKPVAMILPVPVERTGRADDLRFVNLKPYPAFFADLRSLFPVRRSWSVGATGPSKAATAAPAPLPVHAVGDFVASYVPKLDDFDRLDPRFRLPRAVWDGIPMYRDYGFAVFQLRADRATPTTVHPMAFTFETRDPARFFFPTVHIHDGEVHAREEFDHALYCQAGTARLTSFDSSSTVPGKTLHKRRMPALLAPDVPVQRRILKGRLPNADTYANL